QSFPGLQSNFRPPIDSGEETYVGTGRLRGRRALITGGDSGIGRAVAIAFAREGADVAINYLSQEQPDADVVQSLVEAEGRNFFAIPGDLLNETFCTELISSAAESLGGLDILVHNAGYARNEFDIRNHSTEQFDRTFRTNVYAGFFLTRAAARIMLPGSSIIYTVSGVAPRGVNYLIDYAATKAALVSFVRSLSIQLAPLAIRINAVAPAITWSNFDSSQGWNTSAVRNIGAGRPWRRAAQPVEMAPLYVTLAESINSFTSGSVFAADGG
ncbi:hypothetical protein M409DRAFT_32913, partial [Zasmidium cellare ATCC 36951]